MLVEVLKIFQNVTYIEMQYILSMSRRAKMHWLNSQLCNHLVLVLLFDWDLEK